MTSLPERSRNQSPQEKKKPSLKFTTKQVEADQGYDKIRSVPEINEGSESDYLNTISQLTGTINEMLGQQLIQQAVQASPGADLIDVKAEAVAAALGEMEPKNAVEGLIITQMVSLHNQMMHYLRLSIEEAYSANEYLSRSLKLNRQFLACLKGLLKYRNRGQQTVVVQNVNVGPDGKAIVGCVQSPLPKQGV